MRQSRPDAGLGYQVKVLKMFDGVPSQVDFLNLMKTLRADIVDALRSKDE